VPYAAPGTRTYLLQAAYRADEPACPGGP